MIKQCGIAKASIVREIARDEAMRIRRQALSPLRATRRCQGTRDNVQKVANALRRSGSLDQSLLLKTLSELGIGPPVIVTIENHEVQTTTGRGSRIYALSAP
jgi:hypothetical protein